MFSSVNRLLTPADLPLTLSNLELSIENADLPVDDRLVSYLAKDLISDGGQWDMAVNLLEVC